MRSQWLFRLVFLAVGLLTASCASTGPFVWYSSLPSSEWVGSGGEYVLGVGDKISVRVYDQENLTTQARIRTDGRIALPLAGEVAAAGKHPNDLARELEVRLKQFIVSPRVTVNVEDAEPITVSVLGEVGTKGTLELPSPATLVQALAKTGGPTDYADKDSIYVLRQTPRFQRIRFTYTALLRNEGNAAIFPLRSGDVIVVE